MANKQKTHSLKRISATMFLIAALLLSLLAGCGGSQVASDNYCKIAANFVSGLPDYPIELSGDDKLCVIEAEFADYQLAKASCEELVEFSPTTLENPSLLIIHAEHITEGRCHTRLEFHNLTQHSFF